MMYALFGTRLNVVNDFITSKTPFLCFMSIYLGRTIKDLFSS